MNEQLITTPGFYKRVYDGNEKKFIVLEMFVPIGNKNTLVAYNSEERVGALFNNPFYKLGYPLLSEEIAKLSLELLISPDMKDEKLIAFLKETANNPLRVLDRTLVFPVVANPYGEFAWTGWNKKSVEEFASNP